MEETHLRGWITPLVSRLALAIAGIPETLFFGSRREAQARANDSAYTSRCAKRIDIYVAVSLLIEILAYGFIWDFRANAPVLCWIVAVLVLYKLLEIPSVVMKITLFDRLEADPNVPHVVASHERMVVLGFLNYFELLICFACIYALGRDHVRLSEQERPRLVRPTVPDAITQFTIGYGDLSPTSWLRAVACVQGLLSLILLVLLIGRFVAQLKGDLSLDEHARGLIHRAPIPRSLSLQAVRAGESNHHPLGPSRPTAAHHPSEPPRSGRPTPPRGPTIPKSGQFGPKIRPGRTRLKMDLRKPVRRLDCVNYAVFRNVAVNESCEAL